MKWISVNEKLPEINKNVLLFTDSSVIEGYKDDELYEEWSFITLDFHGCGCCAGNSDEVTHWQPLPKEPS